MPGFFGSDSLNIWGDEWLKKETLGCSPAHAHSSSGCLQDAASQSCFRPALCPKIYFPSLVCYCLKCQPPPALPRLSCKVFSPSLHLAREVERFLGPFQSFSDAAFSTVRRGLALSQPLLPGSHPSLAGRQMTCLKGATFLGRWNPAHKLNADRQH